MHKICSAALLVTFWYSGTVFAGHPEYFSLDAGIRFFKFSADGRPNEISYNPVFERWEAINRSTSSYRVREYQPLEPLYFNMNLGADVFIKYKKSLMLKIGYDYSNPFGIGGAGRIEYTDPDNNTLSEEKTFEYTSHQINYFLGPIVTVPENRGEIYLGFSVMSPTWVNYRERYTRTENGTATRDYDREFTGFFGSCRTLIGIQMPLTDRIRLGGETVFAFLNYMKLESGSIADHSFEFPMMKWNVSLRYKLF